MIEREVFESSLRHAVDFWGCKSQEEIHSILGPKVARMVGFQQRNPHHCYDLFEHILHTVDGVAEDASILVKVAAFFHDIGKPEVAMEKNGRLVFYGHAKVSAEIARKVLPEIGYSKEEYAEICFYIEHHDDFIQWQLPQEAEKDNLQNAPVISEQTLYKYLKAFTQKAEKAGLTSPVEEMLKNLLMLCYADCSAQAELVFMNGRISDSRKHKQEKIELIRNVIEKTNISCDYMQQNA